MISTNEMAAQCIFIHFEIYSSLYAHIYLGWTTQFNNWHAFRCNKPNIQWLKSHLLKQYRWIALICVVKYNLIVWLSVHWRDHMTICDRETWNIYMIISLAILVDSRRFQVIFLYWFFQRFIMKLLQKHADVLLIKWGYGIWRIPFQMFHLLATRCPNSLNSIWRHLLLNLPPKSRLYFMIFFFWVFDGKLSFKRLNKRVPKKSVSCFISKVILQMFKEKIYKKNEFQFHLNM